MKINKNKLKQIIKEEIDSILEERPYEQEETVFIAFKTGPEYAGLPTGKTYYLEIPKYMLHLG